MNSTTSMIPLTHLGLLKVSGVDAATFLQGQLSSDILALEAKQHQLAAFCNRQGRVLALMDIFRLNDEYFLVVPLEIIKEILLTLQKYIVFAKVKIEDVSLEYQGVASLGRDLLLPHLMSFRSVEHAPVQYWGKNFDLPPATGPINHFILAQMQKLVPLIGQEQSGKFLPHPLGLVQLGIINFKKGCFVGQEIIARMQYRTEVKKTLCYFELEIDDVDKYRQEHECVNLILIDKNQYAGLVITAL